MRKRKETERIIVHHSLSRDVSVDTIRMWHIKRGFADIGYHYLIHQDGTVEIGRELHDMGAHTKGRNIDSIGICLLGNFKEHAPTMMQYDNLDILCNSLSTVFCKVLPVEYHHEECPAKLFDREFFEGME